MHDGSVATLDAMIEHYAAGGRTISGGPNAGVGRDNPNNTPSERADLIAFLESLTDDAFLTDPRLADPFRRASPPR